MNLSDTNVRRVCVDLGQSLRLQRCCRGGFRDTRRDMQIKKVYVNDVLVGQASTWAEVHRLLGLQGVHFMGKPGAAEGPGAFYLSGTVSRSQEKHLRSVDETA